MTIQDWYEFLQTEYPKDLESLWNTAHYAERIHAADNSISLEDAAKIAIGVRQLWIEHQTFMTENRYEILKHINHTMNLHGGLYPDTEDERLGKVTQDYPFNLESYLQVKDELVNNPVVAIIKEIRDNYPDMADDPDTVIFSVLTKLHQIL